MATAPTLPSPPKPGPVAVPALHAKMSKGPGKIGVLLFGVVLIIGVVYAGSNLLSDLSGVHNTSIMPYVLLGLALLVALGFEFVNGFHDTANAVATVIYTHSLEPHVAVVWSGFWNFLGVLTSSGLVAFGIISLLPVELILQVGQQGGVRHGVCPAGSRYHLESQHLVFRTAGVKFAHPDWIDYRSWYRQPAHVRQDGHQWRGLGTSSEHWQVTAAFADRRISAGRSPAFADERRRQESKVV